MRVLVALVTVVLSQVVTQADKDVAKDVEDVKVEKCTEAGEELTDEERLNIYDKQLVPNANVDEDGGHLF
jgi:cell division septation protein DedD